MLLLPGCFHLPEHFLSLLLACQNSKLKVLSGQIWKKKSQENGEMTFCYKYDLWDERILQSHTEKDLTDYLVQLPLFYLKDEEISAAFPMSLS